MKKHLFAKLLAVVLIFSFSATFAQENFWFALEGKNVPSASPMTSNVDDYIVLSLHQSNMKSFLMELSTDSDHALEVILPDPEKNFRKFLIWNTPMMEPELAKKFPEIQTFTAYAADDESVSAKIDITPEGFRALVFDGSKTYLINPYNSEAEGFYVAFYKKDMLEDDSWTCLVNDGNDLDISGLKTILSDNKGRQIRNERRTYRLAVSTTGEYAEIVGAMTNPSVGVVLSAVVSTINRVNGVFEREFAITFNLVNNNEAVIFTSPRLDPYDCNNNLSCILPEVQGVMDTRIGDLNYDIGHVFCTAGGGRATLASLCSTGTKGSGASTTAGPDNYMTIIHEIGHQLGANHTFSSATGSCFDNGAETSAYEPGSGSTIMSYAGNCSPNDIQSVRDEYFGIASLIEISTYLIEGNGSTCGSITPQGGAVDFEERPLKYVIPLNTPFELTGPQGQASQQNAHLLYNWEQYDLGNFGQKESDNGEATEGPSFKSAEPSPNRTRIFPPIEYILDGTYGHVGERLPLVARELNFKYTVRSVIRGIGNFKYMDSVVNVEVASKAEFRVMQPSQDSIWNPGEIKQITWDVGGTKDDPIKCDFVNIYLSLDDAESFPYLIVSNAPNTGSYSYTVDDVGTVAGRIKVKGTGNIFFDIGDGKLVITGTNTSIGKNTMAQNMKIYPNPATNLINIENENNENNPTKVIAYNILGQKIYEGNMTKEISVSTANWARGQYVFHFLDERTGNTHQQKVILR